MWTRTDQAGRWAGIWSALVVASVLEVALAAAFPKARGYVNDFAGLLDPATAAEIDSMLRDTERKTSAEVALVTVPSLDGLTVEDYANRLFAEWGIGKKGANNGVLVLVAPAERKVRIEVGYGLEQALPDGLAGDVIRNQFLPAFRRNDYASGIQAGLARIVTIVGRDGESAAAAARRIRPTESNGPPWFLIVPFLGTFVTIGAFAIGLGIRSKTIGPLIFGGLFMVGPLLIGLLIAFTWTAWLLTPMALAMAIWGYRKGDSPSWRQTLRQQSTTGSSAGWIMGATSGSSSGGSDSSSDFGGGSSGGGGASGSW